MVENTAAPAPAGEPVTDTAAPTRVSLKRFCMDLSKTDRKVEMIGGFYHSESVAGHLLDTQEAYLERYAVFAKATPK